MKIRYQIKKKTMWEIAWYFVKAVMLECTNYALKPTSYHL